MTAGRSMRDLKQGWEVIERNWSRGGEKLDLCILIPFTSMHGVQLSTSSFVFLVVYHFPHNDGSTLLKQKRT